MASSTCILSFESVFFLKLSSLEKDKAEDRAHPPVRPPQSATY